MAVKIRGLDKAIEKLEKVGGRGALKLLNERISGAYTGPPRRVVLPATLEVHMTA